VHDLKEDIKELLLKFLKNSMKRILIIILFFNISILAAQEEKENYKNAILKFKDFYNAKSYDSIFAMFNVDMKKACN